MVTKLAAKFFEIDSLLIICTPFDQDGIFSVFSKSTGQKCTFNKRGKEPGEYVQPYMEQLKRNKLSSWDVDNVFSEVSIEFEF